MIRRLAASVVGVLVAAACAGTTTERSAADVVTTATSATTTTTQAAPAATTTTATPMPDTESLGGVALDAVEVFAVDAPTGMAWRRGDPALYVIGRRGQVWQVLDGAVQPAPVLDLGARVSDGAERGLLGIAFDPRDGRMFLDYTDLDGHTHVVSWVVRGGRALPETEREVLFVEQPGPGHNGGHLAFDWRGNLFVSLGDGGGSNGRDAQDLTGLHGGLLRITPELDGPGYTVPDDNPFVGRADARPERLVYGMRNPWRFSLDSATGTIWVGDVGNSDAEEVDRITRQEWGRSYGWYFFEGTSARYRDVPDDTVSPVHEYSHAVGVAVVGGYVYRGAEIPALQGAYVFGDLGGQVWVLGTDGVLQQPVRIRTLVSFATDQHGELYAISLDGPVYRLRSR